MAQSRILFLHRTCSRSVGPRPSSYFARTLCMSHSGIVYQADKDRYVIFQLTTHHGLYDEVLEADEQMDADHAKDLRKKKLTFTECIVALVVSLGCVALVAFFLVEQIEYIVEQNHVSEAFMGLILVPLVEKAAEHLTAVDEAYDNQANFALIHVLGASVQTALLNTPIVVIVAWCIGTELDLYFRPFEAIMLILAILVVGNFLRDGKSNYLEGSLCVFVYVIIAVCAYYYPNDKSEAEVVGTAEGGSGGEAVARMFLRAL
ncbi:hypothetical protein MRB53_041194 [Persea americana]|nr:hypothetical protein MRB53_041194 [Persea americana]